MNTYKVVLVGPAGVGKTCALEDAIYGELPETYNPTLGVECHPLQVGERICLNVWDCAGNPKYKGLGSGYYIRAAAGIIVTNDLCARTRYIQDFVEVAPDAELFFVDEGELDKDTFVRVGEALANRG